MWNSQKEHFPSATHFVAAAATGPSRFRTCRLRFMCIDFYAVFKALYVCFDLHGSPLFHPNTLIRLLPSMRAEEKTHTHSMPCEMSDGLLRINRAFSVVVVVGVVRTSHPLTHADFSMWHWKRLCWLCHCVVADWQRNLIGCRPRMIPLCYYGIQDVNGHNPKHSPSSNQFSSGEL